jgi:hypothetical protein
LHDWRLGGRVDPVSQVEGRTSLHREGLQSSTLGESARTIGHEPVEEAVVPILGEVDASAVRGDRDRLVMESTESSKRPWFRESDLVRGGYFEAPTMIHRTRLVRQLRPLLAGDPALPRRRTTGTVPSGPGQAQEVSLHGAGLLVVDDRGGTTQDGSVAAPRVEELGSIHEPKAFEIRSEGAVSEVGVDADLVITDEDGPTRSAIERGHAVVLVGDQKPVVHFLAPSRDDAMGESFGEIEDPGRVGDQSSVTLFRV